MPTLHWWAVPDGRFTRLHVEQRVRSGRGARIGRSLPLDAPTVVIETTLTDMKRELSKWIEIIA